MANSKYGLLCEAIVADLESTPTGMFVDAWAARFDLTSRDVSRVIDKVRKRFEIESVKEGDCGRQPRSRYYLKRHEAAAMAEHEASRGKTWDLGEAGKHWRRVKQERQKAAGVARATGPGSASGYSDARLQALEPRFSQMPLGTYLPADTWTARVYGGGR